MSARNLFHDEVVVALQKDGWTITHDPYRVKIGDRNAYIDLAAENNVLGAERHGEKIAVEIQSFVSASAMAGLELAIGQYILYRTLLTRAEPDRQLFLAVSQETYRGIFSEPIGEIAVSDSNIKIIVFNEDAKEIVKWTK